MAHPTQRVERDAYSTVNQNFPALLYVDAHNTCGRANRAVPAPAADAVPLGAVMIGEALRHSHAGHVAAVDNCTLAMRTRPSSSTWHRQGSVLRLAAPRRRRSVLVPATASRIAARRCRHEPSWLAAEGRSYPSRRVSLSGSVSLAQLGADQCSKDYNLSAVILRYAYRLIPNLAIRWAADPLPRRARP